MLTHALCQTHVAFITPVLISTLRANKVMLHVQSVIIPKHLSQQLESPLFIGLDYWIHHIIRTSGGFPQMKTHVKPLPHLLL